MSSFGGSVNQDKGARIWVFSAVLLAVTGYLNASVWSDQQLHYSFQVPEGWVQMPDEVIDQVFTEVENLSGVSKRQYETGFQSPADNYFTYPYLLVKHYETDRTTISQIQDAMGEANDTPELDTLRTSGFLNEIELQQPVVDSSLRAVLIRMESEVPEVGRVSGLMAIFPGRDGMVGIYLYSLADEFEQNLPVFNAILATVEFEAGHEYSWIHATGVNNMVRDGVIGAVLAGLFGAIAAAYRRKTRAQRNPTDESPPDPIG